MSYIVQRACQPRTECSHNVSHCRVFVTARLAKVSSEDLTVDQICTWLVGYDEDDAAIISAAATARWTDYITCIHPRVHYGLAVRRGRTSVIIGC